MTDTSTETALGPAGSPQARRVPYLFVAVEASRPLAGGARLALDDLDEIIIGRGDTRAITRTGRSATLTIPDRRMSAQHARPSMPRWSRPTHATTCGGYRKCCACGLLMTTNKQQSNGSVPVP